jgi:7-keto-8-aminopelargonate synthetase-like enzyme
MIPWLDELRQSLDEQDARSLRRQLIAHAPCDGPGGRWIERGGRRLINLASNDYLALAGHRRLIAAAVDATQRYGVGGGASRLVTGNLPLHEEVERRFAAFKHADAALLLPTGYMANLAVLTTLARPGDLICLDKLCHASLIDAARFSGATVRIFPHLNYNKLRRLLADASAREPVHREHPPAADNHESATGHHPPAIGRPQSAIRHRQSTIRTFIVTDSVFSMDGDVADLPALCDLADEFAATLIVDEAHGTGVLGDTGSGLCEAMGVTGRVDVVISTASKALAGLGGVITACRVVIDTLINFARDFIFTTAPPPAQAATILAALDVVRDEPWRRQRLRELSARVRHMLGDIGLGPPAADAGKTAGFATPIVPIIAGSPQAAMALSEHLATAGIHAPAIRPPTVAANAARVRLSLRADLMDGDLLLLRDALAELPTDCRPRALPARDS